MSRREDADDDRFPLDDNDDDSEDASESLSDSLNESKDSSIPMPRSWPYL